MGQRSPVSAATPVAGRRERTPTRKGGGPCMCGVRVPGDGEWSEAGALATCGPPGASLAGLLDADQRRLLRDLRHVPQRRKEEL